MSSIQPNSKSTPPLPAHDPLIKQLGLYKDARTVVDALREADNSSGAKATHARGAVGSSTTMLIAAAFGNPLPSGGGRGRVQDNNEHPRSNSLEVAQTGHPSPQPSPPFVDWRGEGAREGSAPPLLYVVAHLDDADEATDELNGRGVKAMRLPALEVLPGESNVSLELFAERLTVVRHLVTAQVQAQDVGVIVAPVTALMQSVPDAAQLEELALTVRTGGEVGLDRLINWLANAGYNRLDSIEEPGDFAVRGGIVDIFIPGAATVRINGDDQDHTLSELAVRLDFFGDEVDSIAEIDLGTMGSDRAFESVEIVGAMPGEVLTDKRSVSFLDYMPRNSAIVLAEPLEAAEQARGYFERVTDGGGVTGPAHVFKALQEKFASYLEVSSFGSGGVSASDPEVDLPVRTLPAFDRDAAEAVKELAQLAQTHRTVVYCQNDAEAARLGELIAEFSPEADIERVVCYLHRGFVVEDDNALDPEFAHGGAPKPLAFVPHHELLHRTQTRRRIRRLKGGSASEAFLDLQVGDYVVHSDHGICKFTGLKSMKPRAVRERKGKAADDRLREVGVLKEDKHKDDAQTASNAEEYLTLEFAAKAKLHVPVTQVDKVQKYIGGFRGKPKLSTLGGKRWQAEKDKVKESVRELAGEMLRVQAARQAMPGVRYPNDTAWQKEFEAEFPYQETDDQLAAIAEITKDMAGDRPMDRLLCGDVGFGKTEMAIRAAFKAAEFGKQVAVLVPTTLLAVQHERTFRSRFAGYPFRVESLTRFKSRKQQNDTLAAVRKGQVDIVIGTHRILSKDVRFGDLGLVIVDEEQKFGVEDKQRLLEFRTTVDVLTLSATPIPRTLHMSMLGLRDISSLTTPPLDRRAVVTEVVPYSEGRIKRAIQRELAREGRVFFLHNRVHDIKSVADDINRLVPDAKVVIGHGQMGDGELEQVMMQFVNGEANVLVSTTIIESGIDIPSANTMIIDSADMFGLAELHQLRGRVGRSKHRGYCYLLLPKDRPANETAVKRLRAIEEYSMLGAGFKIAMRDLEIRGAGNLLGAEQSGHIAAVGYDMYCQLLEQTTRELRNEKRIEPADTTVEIGLTGSIPKAYIPSDTRRLEAYRRIATARTPEELDKVRNDITGAYGEPPEQTDTLLDVALLRVRAALIGVRSISVHERDVVWRTSEPKKLEAALSEARGSVRPLSGTDNEGLVKVHYRPPENYLEPTTLLTVLRARLGPT